MLKAGTNLYAYKIDEKTFDTVALSLYMASGKFDKNSMSRWTNIMTRYKAQLIRASIDNSVIFLPVGDTRSRNREDLRNSPIIICCDTCVYAMGIIVRGPCVCPSEYKTTCMDKLIAVHVLSTSFTASVTLDELRDVEGTDYLPENIFKLVDDISDTIHIEKPASWEFAYEKQIMFAHWFRSCVEAAFAIETPSRLLELERQKRLRLICDFLDTKTDVTFPPPRPFVFHKMMKTHEKYAHMFHRLIK